MPADDKMPGSITPVSLNDLETMEVSGSEPTPELRFVERLPPQPPMGTGNSDVNAVYLQRKQRILQQKWVTTTHVMYRGVVGKQYEWRDVPLEVEPVATQGGAGFPKWCPGCSRNVDEVCHHFNCAVGPHGLQAQIDGR